MADHSVWSCCTVYARHIQSIFCISLCFITRWAFGVMNTPTYLAMNVSTGTCVNNQRAEMQYIVCPISKSDIQQQDCCSCFKPCIAAGHPILVQLWLWIHLSVGNLVQVHTDPYSAISRSISGFLFLYVSFVQKYIWIGICYKYTLTLSLSEERTDKLDNEENWALIIKTSICLHYYCKPITILSRGICWCTDGEFQYQRQNNHCQEHIPLVSWLFKLHADMSIAVWSCLADTVTSKSKTAFQRTLSHGTREYFKCTVLLCSKAQVLICEKILFCAVLYEITAPVVFVHKHMCL